MFHPTLLLGLESMALSNGQRQQGGAYPSENGAQLVAHIELFPPPWSFARTIGPSLQSLSRIFPNKVGGGRERELGF